MKTIVTILFFYISLVAFSQYDNKDIKRLYKLESSLTEPWEMSIDTLPLYEIGINLPTIYIDLFLNSTSIKGVTIGASIYLWPVCESKRLKSIILKDTSSQSEHFFLQTKSYLVYIPYGETINTKYNIAFKKLMPELVAFFDKNKRRL